MGKLVIEIKEGEKLYYIIESRCKEQGVSMTSGNVKRLMEMIF